MEIIKYIGCLIFGICVLLILGYLMSFITGGISKFFGTTSTLNGRVVATPDTFDDNIRELKELKNRFTTAYKNYKSKSKSDKSDLSEKLKLLLELDRLRENNIINQEEYNQLKSKILD